MHKHDIDTREVGRSTLTAALAVRVVGSTDHCRQSSHQRLGVVLQPTHVQMQRAEAKSIQHNGWGKDQSAAAVPVLCAVCCCGSERKRSDEESWS